MPALTSCYSILDSVPSGDEGQTEDVQMQMIDLRSASVDAVSNFLKILTEKNLFHGIAIYELLHLSLKSRSTHGGIWKPSLIHGCAQLPASAGRANAYCR